MKSSKGKTDRGESTKGNQLRGLVREEGSEEGTSKGRRVKGGSVKRRPEKGPVKGRIRKEDQ